MDQKKKEITSKLSAQSLSAQGLSAQGHHKTMRRINPLGMRVVVRIRKSGDQTESGLYLPEGAKQAMSESLIAEVIEVATAREDHSDDETNVSGIPLGAMVLIKKDTGCKIPWDEDLRIVETKDVLATIDELQIS